MCKTSLVMLYHRFQQGRLIWWTPFLVTRYAAEQAIKLYPHVYRIGNPEEPEEKEQVIKHENNNQKC